MLGEGLKDHVSIVLPVSGCTDTDVSTGGKGGSVMQSICGNALADNKVNKVMII
jgi:hypothetical protein